MNNETKRDVFDEAVNELEDVKSSNGNLHPTQELLDYEDRYSAAIPDDIPVIPKAVADWIEKCKHDGTSVGDMLCSERRPEKMRDWMALTPGTYEFNQKRYTECQNLLARAWLDGYTVEEEHD